ncbi:MAG TPA: hypothetical protein VHA74_01410 [Candidatus Dojkabacteria bacterium]|nr:hypothetical protein [Candidatus Dojkabacteria bacterium]
MADISNNNQNVSDNTVNTPVATNTPTPANNPSETPVDPNAPVNTGEQYEVNELHPEDLDVQWTRWKCLVCNYMYEGSRPLKKCPRCGNEDPDKFADID